MSMNEVRIRKKGSVNITEATHRQKILSRQALFVDNDIVYCTKQLWSISQLLIPVYLKLWIRVNRNVFAFYDKINQVSISSITRSVLHGINLTRRKRKTEYHRLSGLGKNSACIKQSTQSPQFPQLYSQTLHWIHGNSTVIFELPVHLHEIFRPKRRYFS